MPKKRCQCCTDFGKGKSLIALTFSGSGEIPSPDILSIKNISSVAPKEHLPLFSFKPDFRILFKTCSVRMSYCFRVDPHMMISSRLFLFSHNHLLFPRCPVGIKILKWKM